MKDTKFSRFIFEAGKIFVSILAVMIPIIYSDAFVLNWHIGLKIGMFILLFVEYAFLFYIIDKACDANDRVKENNKQINKNKEKGENHQMIIDEFLEEKDKKDKK